MDLGLRVCSVELSGQQGAAGPGSFHGVVIVEANAPSGPADRKMTFRVPFVSAPSLDAGLQSALRRLAAFGADLQREAQSAAQAFARRQDSAPPKA